MVFASSFSNFSIHSIYLDWDVVLAFRSQFHFCVVPQIHHFLCRCSSSVKKRLLPVGFQVGLSGLGNQCSPWFCSDVFCFFFGTSEMIVAYDSDSRVSILFFKGFREWRGGRFRERTDNYFYLHYTFSTFSPFLIFQWFWTFCFIPGFVCSCIYPKAKQSLTNRHVWHLCVFYDPMQIRLLWEGPLLTQMITSARRHSQPVHIASQEDWGTCGVTLYLVHRDSWAITPCVPKLPC